MEYPSTPATLENAGSAQLTITTAATLTGVDYAVVANGVAVTVFATPTGRPRDSASEVVVQLSLPVGHVKALFPALRKTVRLTSVGGRFIAAANFSVKPPFTGMAYNGLTASAAIPEVTISAPSANPVLTADYGIPSGGSYDWSLFPPFFIMATDVTWQFHLAKVDTAGQVVVGTNGPRQASDSFRTFLAGSLVALGLSAFLVAIQEALSRFWG
jgi:hypothetical protein